MATAREFDYFGAWRSPQSSDHTQVGDEEQSKLNNQDISKYAPTSAPLRANSSTMTSGDVHSGDICISPKCTTATSPVGHTSSSVSISSNPFSITADSTALSHSCSSLEREQRGSQKSSGGLSGEHNVKGGKTAKRGKVQSNKMRMLSLTDIENGFSCFSSSSSSLVDTLADLSPDRLLNMSEQHQESNYSWDETGGGAGKRTKISHPSPQSTTWDIDGGLAADFDGSLSGLGTELGTSSYKFSEALLALPVFKQENLEIGFQYILGAATSPAVKMNEETLTYLNQGQSYEMKVKKLGELSEFQGKCFRSVVKIQFHERRLQYMEKEQMDQWKHNRPGERILDIDIPLSYGLVEINLDASKIHQADFVWDPTKENGLHFKVHAISTEFTAKKHGGEKGVPFRIQMETYSHNDGESKLLHAASCQIKVFKPKGADRKHKTDREKMEKRSETEKEKYQPSYECTVLTEVPLEQVAVPQSTFGVKNSSASLATSFSELSCGKSSGASPVASTLSTASPSPSSTPTRHLPAPLPHPPQTVASSPPHLYRLPLQSPQQLFAISPAPLSSTDSKSSGPLSGDATLAEVQNWLTYHRFSSYSSTFQNFSGADLLRLTRDDMIQICGLADGIRLDNALQSKCVRPKLTIFISQEPDSVYHAVYMRNVAVDELKIKLALLFGLESKHIGDLYLQGPSSIHVLVTDEVLYQIQNQSRFTVEGMKDESAHKFCLLLKSVQ